VTDAVDTLFDEYAARWARGERPDAADYLDRAGREREELAGMIDRYLAAAPPGEPDETTVRFVLELYEKDEPPLLAARVARGLKVREVVDWLVESFGLPADKTSKVSAYWHELEGGRRRPQDVAPELWGKVVELLGPTAEAARGWSPSPVLAADVRYHRLRTESFASEAAASPPAPSVEEPSQPDEVDRLFGYGP
jgi:hypothetical protein